ncbi:MAG: acetyl-CoA carboxylase biotin carboxyl carrier protein [Acidobacteriota bacterium]|jgi:acetyl-CoA carboxylase biotin carboxyl carrier protein|nr:acetyl-CoA carboxylase biotin carboxyl carrier protein [Acidobacteriota bacterium]
MNEEGATQPAQDEQPQQPSKQAERTGGAARDRDRGGRRRHQQNQPRRPDQQLPMDELRDLFALFTEHGLTEFEIERDGFRVHLGRNLAPQIINAPPATTHTQTAAAPTAAAPPVGSGEQTASTAAETSGAQGAEQPPAEESLHIITSPIVGTFYRTPSPTAEPFVRLGSPVNSDTVVCIIEAMKLMNEIQAETNGEIAKIYVENGQPVEFGQPLFGVKK